MNELHTLRALGIAFASAMVVGCAATPPPASPQSASAPQLPAPPPPPGCTATPGNSPRLLGLVPDPAIPEEPMPTGSRPAFDIGDLEKHLRIDLARSRPLAASHVASAPTMRLVDPPTFEPVAIEMLRQ
jgi:hypothetical protein